MLILSAISIPPKPSFARPDLSEDHRGLHLHPRVLQGHMAGKKTSVLAIPVGKMTGEWMRGSFLGRGVVICWFCNQLLQHIHFSDVPAPKAGILVVRWYCGEKTLTASCHGGCCVCCCFIQTRKYSSKQKMSAGTCISLVKSLPWPLGSLLCSII